MGSGREKGRGDAPDVKVQSGSDLTRISMVLHYDGRRFSGWQYQPDVRTVQGELEAKLRILLGDKTFGRVIGAGRTDAGVHATGQVAAVDVPARWSADGVRAALNATLADDLWVESARVARRDFHPRFDARRRSYLYRLGTLPGSASPFERRTCWPLNRTLDADVLETGAELLVGTRCFRGLSKAGRPDRGYECTVLAAEWSAWRLGHGFRITANRYLHRMVRYIVGTLVDVAGGRRPLSDVEALLDGAPGVATSPPAPPQGLFLTSVDYADPRTTQATAAGEPATRRPADGADSQLLSSTRTTATLGVPRSNSPT